MSNVFRGNSVKNTESEIKRRLPRVTKPADSSARVQGLSASTPQLCLEDKGFPLIKGFWLMKSSATGVGQRPSAVMKRLSKKTL